MKVAVLLENTKLENSNNLKEEHGLSLYIETKSGKKILFDCGPETGSIIHNAKEMGIDLGEVDYAVISHGHKDHGGGISHFLEVNEKATIFLKEDALIQHSYKMLFFQIPIGLDRSLLMNDRIMPIQDKDFYQLDDNIIIHSKRYLKTGFFPDTNKVLYKKVGDTYVPDDFHHELILEIVEDGKSAFFTGCSHSGITNMIDSVIHDPTEPCSIVGGMHLYNPVSKKYVSDASIETLGRDLNKYKNAVFYTGHCTGEFAYNKLKEKMNSHIEYIRTGWVFEI